MNKKRKLVYESHPRDYTIIGATSAMHLYCTKEWLNCYGMMLPEIVSIIKNGKYIYYVQTDSLYEVIRSFIRTKLNMGKVNMEKLWRDYDELIDNYFMLIRRPISKYSKYMLLDFYDYYNRMLPTAYVGAYAIDCMDEIKPSIRKKFALIAEKIRRKGELVYKEGESKFIPNYLKWLSKKRLIEYSPKLMQYIYYKEMEGWILGKGKLPSIKELKSRQKLLVVRQYPVNKYSLLTGVSAKKYLKKLQASETSVKHISFFKGTTAQSGIAQGIVKIVRYYSDMNGFKKGQILVSPMTQPNFLPVMKMAAAFITDEGGTLSHAAIVSRELKKPCVIGTKIATKVLKNGDLVEVNANNGTITKK